jgi:FMN reductase
MSGVLKNLLDQLPVAALREKPVGLVSMGASDHHFLGAERHLRDVLAFFAARVMPVAVYLTSANFDRGAIDEKGAALLDDLFLATASVADLMLTAGLSQGPAPLGARRPA